MYDSVAGMYDSLPGFSCHTILYIIHASLPLTDKMHLSKKNITLTYTLAHIIHHVDTIYLTPYSAFKCLMICGHLKFSLMDDLVLRMIHGLQAACTEATVARCSLPKVESKSLMSTPCVHQKPRERLWKLACFHIVHDLSEQGPAGERFSCSFSMAMHG